MKHIFIIKPPGHIHHAIEAARLIDPVLDIPTKMDGLHIIVEVCADRSVEIRNLLNKMEYPILFRGVQEQPKERVPHNPGQKE
jgi:hypothetical protein